MDDDLSQTKRKEIVQGNQTVPLLVPIFWPSYQTKRMTMMQSLFDDISGDWNKGNKKFNYSNSIIFYHLIY